MVSRTRCRAIPLGLMVWCLACTGAGSDDSVGPLPEWRIASEPALVIGALGSSTEAALHRISNVVRLQDGRVVVADGGLESRLSVFSPEGRPLGTIGRQGDGPGEYGWIMSLQKGPNDSLYVFDPGRQRLTVFTSDGRLGRTASYGVTGGATGNDGLGSVSRLTEDVWVGRGQDSPRQGPLHEIVRDTISVGLLDGTLDGLEVLVRLPSLMSTTTTLGNRRAFGHVPFSAVALTTTWGRCAFVARAETPTVSVYSARGDLVATFEGPGAVRPVTQEHVDAWFEYRLRNVSGEEASTLRRMLREQTRTTHLPYYHQMVIDEWGHIWLQEYSPPVGLGDRWYVLSQSGEHVADVAMPEALRAFSITDDGVLGSTRGEYDEERVELWPFEARPAESTDVLSACRSSER